MYTYLREGDLRWGVLNNNYTPQKNKSTSTCLEQVTWNEIISTLLTSDHACISVATYRLCVYVHACT